MMTLALQFVLTMATPENGVHAQLTAQLNEEAGLVPCLMQCLMPGPPHAEDMCPLAASYWSEAQLLELRKRCATPDSPLPLQADAAPTRARRVARPQVPSPWPRP